MKDSSVKTIQISRFAGFQDISLATTESSSKRFRNKFGMTCFVRNFTVMLNLRRAAHCSISASILKIFNYRFRIKKRAAKLLEFGITCVFGLFPHSRATHAIFKIAFRIFII